MDWKEANNKLIGKRIEVRDRLVDDWRELEAEMFFNDNSVRCVEKGQENRKKNGDPYSVQFWNHWRPIPEKTKRPITNKELMEAGANWLWDKEGNRYVIINLSENTESIIFATSTHSIVYMKNIFIENGWTWSSSTEPNVRRSFEVEE